MDDTAQFDESHSDDEVGSADRTLRVTLNRPAAAVAAAYGFVSVALGAWAAHGLEDWIAGQYADLYYARGITAAAQVETFETGVRYLMVHAVALVALAVFPFSNRLVRTAILTLAAGAALFSGSLFALVLLDIPKLGAVTPLGGLLLLVGWFSLFLSAVRSR